MENFLNVISDVLDRELDKINITDDFRNYEEWDSLSVLAVLAAMNDEYDVVIPRADFDKLKTLNDLYKYVTG